MKVKARINGVVVDSEKAIILVKVLNCDFSKIRNYQKITKKNVVELQFN
jgi:hypothetical protein